MIFVITINRNIIINISIFVTAITSPSTKANKLTKIGLFITAILLIELFIFFYQI